MLKRLHTLTILEAGLTGLFFIQALRFLVGMIYSRVAGASAVTALQAAQIPIEGSAIDPALVQTEITFLLYMVALPLLTLFIGRFRFVTLVAALIVAVGRLLMMPLGVLTQTGAAALVLGGGLIYIAMIARNRAQMLPYMFIIGFGADQLLRAIGNTVDPTLASWFVNYQVGLTAAAVIVSLIAYFAERSRLNARVEEEGGLSSDDGLLPFWGAVGLSGLLYLEFALLALPNAIAGRADTDYATFAPPLLAATLLPLIPAVRGRARAFIALFDGGVRGWLWMLIIALLIIFGTRLTGIIAGAALVLAQFFVSMMWWWLVKPRSQRQRSYGGLWLMLGALLFMLLVAGDNFTYEYAFVRDFTGDFAFLNAIIPPLLRGFRGLGLALLLLAVFLAALPMTQTIRRIAWVGGASALRSLLALVVIAAVTMGAAVAVQPPVVQGVSNATEIRVAAYNLHGGYDEFYNYDLNAIAQTIESSGAQVVLLQEVDAGRLASFGVDQSLWLARRLRMDRRFYATNEGLQGLAVLSKAEISFDDGRLLNSLGTQTGIQRVQIVPASRDAPVMIYNTWLSPLLEVSSEQTVEAQQQDQQQQLYEVFALYFPQGCPAIPGYSIFGGTFHNVPDSPMIEGVRNAGFTDVFAGLPLELSATFVRTGLPPARFDYLWTCKFPTLEYGPGVLSTTASTHRLIVAELPLTR